jgi:hypothetical protein
MKTFDQNSLEEQSRLVSRYVAGDLSRSERAEFETWLVAAPELAAEVEMERRLRRGMASAARRGWLNRHPPDTGPDRRWRIAAAASVLLAAGLALSLFVLIDNGSRGETRLAAGADSSRAASLTIRLGNVRGFGNTPDITVSLANAPGALVIEPDVVVLTCEGGAIELECAGGGTPQIPQYAEYEMDLVNRRGTTLAWRSPRQRPLTRTQLSFTMRDPGSLDAGNYDLIVRGHATDHAEVVARFWLKVSAP